jgi:hypothetical protein
MSDEQIHHSDLVGLLDDFVEFNDYCSFLCDVFPALLSDFTVSEHDSHTIQGVKRHCGELKDKAKQLECALNKLYQQSYTRSMGAESLIFRAKPSNQ